MWRLLVWVFALISPFVGPGQAMTPNLLWQHTLPGTPIPGFPGQYYESSIWSAAAHPNGGLMCGGYVDEFRRITHATAYFFPTLLRISASGDVLSAIELPGAIGQQNVGALVVGPDSPLGTDNSFWAISPQDTAFLSSQGGVYGGRPFLCRIDSSGALVDSVHLVFPPLPRSAGGPTQARRLTKTSILVTGITTDQDSNGYYNAAIAYCVACPPVG